MAFKSFTVWSSSCLLQKCMLIMKDVEQTYSFYSFCPYYLFGGIYTNLADFTKLGGKTELSIVQRVIMLQLI